MKLLLRRFILLSFAWMVLGSSTTSKEASVPKAKQTMYYWYWVEADQLFEYASIATAQNDWLNLTGIPLWTGWGYPPFGRGYTNNVFPHNTLPAVTLYER